MKIALFSETCEYEVPTNFGADYSPRTPEIISQRKVLPEDEPIVSKIATLIQKTEEESKKVTYFRFWLKPVNFEMFFLVSSISPKK